MPTITSVSSSNTIYSNSSLVVVTGEDLGNAAYAKITTGTKEVLVVDYVVSNTSPQFTSPSSDDIFLSGVKFTNTANLKLLDAQSNVVAWKIVEVKPPPTQNTHNVTDISEASNTGSIYFGQSPAIVVGDQILYDTTSAQTHPVSIDSQGFAVIESSTDDNDSFTYRVWNSEYEVWGDPGTFIFEGGVAAATYISNKIKMYIRAV